MTKRIIDWTEGLVADGPLPSRRARVYRVLLALAIIGATAVAILETIPGIWGSWEGWETKGEHVALALMSADYALRLFRAGRQKMDGESKYAALVRYAISPYGIFDVLAVAPFLVGLVLPIPVDMQTLFGVVRVLKLARFSPALETLGVVILSEARPLLSALFIMALLAIFTSTLLYFVERTANPNFSNIPRALWWSIVTLATLGYGDVVPITTLGKVVGSGVAVLGLCMFALPASILASGFNEEMRRQSFVTTWHLVARVPFFSRLPAAQIAEVASLLKPRRATRGEVLVREGDVGESMFFIVSGKVAVHAHIGTIYLKDGSFFGEIALLEQIPRTATVRAATRCQLLVLDARDFQKFTKAYPSVLKVVQETARNRMAELTPSPDP